MQGGEIDKDTMRKRGWSIHSEASNLTTTDQSGADELTGDEKRTLLESFPSDAVQEMIEGDAKENGEVIETEEPPLKKQKKEEEKTPTKAQQELLDLAKTKLSKWAARLFDPNRPRGLVEAPQVIPLNDEFLTAFGRREKKSDAALGRTIEIDNELIEDGDDDDDEEDDNIEEAGKRDLGSVDGRKLKIVNLAYTTTQETLEAACGKFGPLVETNLLMDKDSLTTDKPVNVGRAYVTFETISDAEKCLAGLSRLDGRLLRIFVAPEESKRSRKSTGGTGSNARYWLKDISTVCYRCGEVGHIEANCPNAAKPKPCNLCGKLGHDMRDCNMAKICFRCGLPGHISRDCTFRQAVPRRMLCGICFQSGHHRVSCRRRREDAPSHNALCMVCGKSGHFMCTEMKWFFGVSGVYCFNCGEKGHLGYDCDRPNVDVCVRDESKAKEELDRAENKSR